MRGKEGKRLKWRVKKENSFKCFMAEEMHERLTISHFTDMSQLSASIAMVYR